MKENICLEEIDQPLGKNKVQYHHIIQGNSAAKWKWEEYISTAKSPIFTFDPGDQARIICNASIAHRLPDARFKSYLNKKISAKAM